MKSAPAGLLESAAATEKVAPAALPAPLPVAFAFTAAADLHVTIIAKHAAAMALRGVRARLLFMPWPSAKRSAGAVPEAAYPGSRRCQLPACHLVLLWSAATVAVLVSGPGELALDRRQAFGGSDDIGV